MSLLLQKLKLFFNFIQDSSNLKIIIMKTTILTVFVSLFIIVFNGCAPVQIYSNKALTEKTGLKYYTVKPFLHIERDSESNRILKATVIYLPDLANPQYIVIRDGLGSRRFNLQFTNGSINTFGYSSISKVGESVDALAALITKGTAALTDLNALKGLQAVKAPSNTVELYEIIFGADKTTLREVISAKD
jgi:hypothetical protein